MSVDDWLSATIEARNRQEKRDRIIFITVVCMFIIILVVAFAFGAGLA